MKNGWLYFEKALALFPGFSVEAKPYGLDKKHFFTQFFVSRLILMF